jgi:hypothetical protein
MKGVRMTAKGRKERDWIASIISATIDRPDLELNTQLHRFPKNQVTHILSHSLSLPVLASAVISSVAIRVCIYPCVRTAFSHVTPSAHSCVYFVRCSPDSSVLNSVTSFSLRRSFLPLFTGLSWLWLSNDHRQEALAKHCNVQSFLFSWLDSQRVLNVEEWM